MPDTDSTTHETSAAATQPVSDRAVRRIGKYELLRALGHGGMGTVYLAEHTDQGQRARVALKLIRPDVIGPEAKRRFLNEAHILEGVSDDHVVRLIDSAISEDGLPFLVMEYVEGEPIDCYCNGRRLDIDSRLRLFVDLCSAVHYLHTRAIAHPT